MSKDGNSISIQINSRGNTPSHKNLQQQQQQHYPEINFTQVYQHLNSNNSNSLDGELDPKKSYLDDSGSPTDINGEMNLSASKN